MPSLNANQFGSHLDSGNLPSAGEEQGPLSGVGGVAKGVGGILGGVMGVVGKVTTPIIGGLLGGGDN